MWARLLAVGLALLISAAVKSQQAVASEQLGISKTQANQPSAPAAPSAASQSAYVSAMSAAIRSRLIYPPAARARGARGVVGVDFTIAASGALSSFAITRSSGDEDLDAAARALVQSVRFPPTPGGPVHVAMSVNYVPSGGAVINGCSELKSLVGRFI